MQIYETVKVNEDKTVLLWEIKLFTKTKLYIYENFYFILLEKSFKFMRKE